MQILSAFGFIPVREIDLLFPVIALGIWLIFLPFAYLRQVKIFYNASLRAAFGEELLFRGIIFGVVRLLGYSQLIAVLVSSILFGLFHMRNLWWAGWRRSWKMTRYAGFTGGPIFAGIRIVSGDIYLGILIHFLHNLLIIFPLPGTRRFVALTPRDQELEKF